MHIFSARKHRGNKNTYSPALHSTTFRLQASIHLGGTVGRVTPYPFLSKVSTLEKVAKLLKQPTATFRILRESVVFFTIQSGQCGAFKRRLIKTPSLLCQYFRPISFPSWKPYRAACVIACHNHVRYFIYVTMWRACKVQDFVQRMFASFSTLTLKKRRA